MLGPLVLAAVFCLLVAATPVFAAQKASETPVRINLRRYLRQAMFPGAHPWHAGSGPRGKVPPLLPVISVPRKVVRRRDAEVLLVSVNDTDSSGGEIILARPDVRGWEESALCSGSNL